MKHSPCKKFIILGLLNLLIETNKWIIFYSNIDGHKHLDIECWDKDTVTSDDIVWYTKFI